MVAEFLLLSMILSDFDPAPYHKWRRFQSLPSLQFSKMQVVYYENQAIRMSKLEVLFPNNVDLLQKRELYERTIWYWVCVVGLQSGNYEFKFDQELNCEFFRFSGLQYQMFIADMDMLDRVLAGNFYQGD
jgi:hypothetical protein